VSTVNILCVRLISALGLGEVMDREPASRAVTADDLEAMLRSAARRVGCRLPARVEAAFRPMADAYFRTNVRPGALRVVLNDAFERAPRAALEGLCESVVVKSSGKGSGREVGAAFWEWAESPEVRDLMEGNYLARQRSFVPRPGGAVYDLGELFDEVNAEFFGGSLERPVLAWSTRPLTHRWGYYSDMVRPRGVLVINRLLDDAQVPRFVLRGTMYHEMLHMVHEPHRSNGRRVVHTREFNEADAHFPEHGQLREEYRRVLRRYAAALRAARALRRRLGRGR
jgi:hypothetical protein